MIWDGQLWGGGLVISGIGKVMPQAWAEETKPKAQVNPWFYTI